MAGQRAFNLKLTFFAAAALLFTVLSFSDCFAKEQPLYVVSNDDTVSLVGGLSGLFPAKQRAIVAEKDAASNKKIHSFTSDKEESSVILVNRSKPDGGVGAFKDMFGGDYIALRPRELLVYYKPKGGTNPNAALLISAPDLAALRLGIRTFMQIDAGRYNRKYVLNKDIYDCLIYTEFSYMYHPDLVELGLLCDT
jgi:hypothetical protein